MSKLALDIVIDRKLKDEDVIVYRNGTWKVATKQSVASEYINKQREKNKMFEEKIKDLEDNLAKLSKAIKENWL